MTDADAVYVVLVGEPYGSGTPKKAFVDETRARQFAEQYDGARSWASVERTELDTETLL